jgi:hypothetical protein
MAGINFDHPAVIAHGDEWVEFVAVSPETLEEIVPVGVALVHRLQKIAGKIQYCEFALLPLKEFTNNA